MQDLIKYYLEYKEVKPGKIYLVRHGETEWNVEERYQGQNDSPLVPEARIKSAEIGKLLKEKEISNLYISPLGRAVETAEILNTFIKKDIVIVDEFKEVYMGLFEGKTKSDQYAEYADFFKTIEKNGTNRFFHPYPEGESYLSVYLRIIQKVLDISATEGNKVIVSHQGVNHIIKMILMDIGIEEILTHRQSNNQVIEVDLISKSEKVYTI